jgi:toluene monooxygenase system protein E
MKPPAPPPPRARYKTYAHLAGAQRIPDEYTLATSQLLYYRARGFEVATPLGAFFAQQQKASRLQARDWDGFVDPRRLTYTRYTALMSQREAFVAQLLEPCETSDYDARLSAPALAVWEAWATLRYPLHALQMASAYVGQLAPSGRVVICAALQAADELRRVQRIAYRMALLRLRDERFGDGARQHWQNNPAWQPLRQVIEQLLVTYDWGEAFAALCLCVKPAVDELTNGIFADDAAAAGDYVARQLFASFAEDSAGHAQWAGALALHALSDTPGNRDVLRDYCKLWLTRITDALVSLAPDGKQRLTDAVRRRLAPLELLP